MTFGQVLSDDKIFHCEWGPGKSHKSTYPAVLLTVLQNLECRSYVLEKMSALAPMSRVCELRTVTDVKWQ